jgi:hypothetical protein
LPPLPSANKEQRLRTYERKNFARLTKTVVATVPAAQKSSADDMLLTRAHGSDFWELIIAATTALA